MLTHLQARGCLPAARQARAWLHHPGRPERRLRRAHVILRAGPAAGV